MTRRVLFVDDEPRILEALRRMLRPQRDTWEMEFAPGGPQALLLVGANHYDAVVTDMRMPEVDGAALLREVARISPDTLRIVLSGHTETEAGFRALPVAHQFLMKPCEAPVLRHAIDAGCGLRALLGSLELRQLVGAVGALPPAPATFLRLGELLARPEVATRDVALVVEDDPALAAKVLQLVNSSFFGQRREVLSIAHAIALLGTAMVRNLTLVREVFRPDGAFGLEPAGLEAEQHHARAVTSLVRRLELPDLDDSDLLIGGLLHDVGRLILSSRVPAPAGRRDAADEYRHLGVSHAEVGAYLLALWGLPQRIVAGVACHHYPTRIEAGAGVTIALALHLADGLVHAAAGGVTGVEAIPVDHAHLATLGLTGRLDAWLALARDLETGGDA